jgi:hypothetical protein
MRVDQAGRDVKAWLRDPDHADAPVVVRDALQQPVDGVVGVRALVDVLRSLLDRHVRPHLLELALRHVAPARVLEDEDEARVLEAAGRTERGAIRVDAVRADAVGRARQQERPRLRGVFGQVDRREQPDAVTHRHEMLVFRVASADLLGAVLGRGGRLLRHDASRTAWHGRDGPCRTQADDEDEAFHRAAVYADAARRPGSHPRAGALQ